VKAYSDPDVVVVGGGIAGTALAVALASRGHSVLVLERETVYRDRGMGEYVQPWGVQALRDLNLLDPLVASGAAVGTGFFAFEGNDGGNHVGRIKRRPLDTVLPGVSGSLQIDHARVNEWLTSEARSAGAQVLRGARLEAVRPGPTNTVEYTHAGRRFAVQTPWLIGADGRRSTVRTHIAATVSHRPVGITCESMLLGSVDGWPAHRNALGNDRDAHFILLGRTDVQRRLYRFRTAAQTGRGRKRSAGLLEAAKHAAAPWGPWLNESVPAGPAIVHQLSEGRSSLVSVPGTTLIGDAAGWSDPLIGQGLSLVFHDVLRLVQLAESLTAPAALTEYAREREQLLARLSICSWLARSLQCDFAPGASERRQAFADRAAQEPLLDVPLSAYVSGPLRAEAAAFAPDHVDHIRSVLAEVDESVPTLASAARDA